MLSELWYLCSASLRWNAASYHEGTELFQGDGENDARSISLSLLPFLGSKHRATGISCKHRNDQPSLLGFLVLPLFKISQRGVVKKQVRQNLLSCPFARSKWLTHKNPHIQDYSYADKTQINFYKCRDMLNTWKSELPGSSWTKPWPLSRWWPLQKRIDNSRDVNYSPLLIKFITWLSQMFSSLMSLDNSNMKFYCICFLFFFLYKWCPHSFCH